KKQLQSRCILITWHMDTNLSLASNLPADVGLANKRCFGSPGFWQSRRSVSSVPVTGSRSARASHLPGGASDGVVDSLRTKSACDDPRRRRSFPAGIGTPVCARVCPQGAQGVSSKLARPCEWDYMVQGDAVVSPSDDP